MSFNPSRFDSKIAITDRQKYRQSARQVFQNKRDLTDIREAIDFKTAREKDLNSVDFLARSLAEIYGLGIEREVFK